MERAKIKKILIVLLILIILALCGFGTYRLILKYLYPFKYSDYVYTYSEKYNVESAWIFAIIKAESNFNENVVSRKWSDRSYANYGGHGKRDSRDNRNGEYRFKGARVQYRNWDKIF